MLRIKFTRTENIYEGTYGGKPTERGYFFTGLNKFLSVARIDELVAEGEVIIIK